MHAQSGDEIKNALFEYLDNNPFGRHFAYCFEDSGEIQKKIRDIQPSLKKLNPAQRISARVEKLRDIIFPYINNYDTKTSLRMVMHSQLWGYIVTRCSMHSFQILLR